MKLAWIVVITWMTFHIHRDIESIQRKLEILDENRMIKEEHGNNN